MTTQNEQQELQYPLVDNDTPYDTDESIDNEDVLKRFLCTYPNCNKSYTRNSRLKFHQRNMHLNQISYYQCHYCGLKFLEKGNLKVHVRRLTGEKPYPC